MAASRVVGELGAVPAIVEGRVDDLLAGLDRAVPGRVVGLYLFGSVALGAFRPGRSDIDFLAVVDGPLDDDKLAAVRELHRRTYRREAVRSLARRRWPLVCNGSFVTTDDLARPPGEIRPMASQTGVQFALGSGFDVNPVIWRELSDRGITCRGPAVATLGLVDDDAELRRWTRENLEAYWRPWSLAVRRRGAAALVGLTQHLSLAWGALGAPRLHCTIATGRVISKPEAGRYALDAFDVRWHPLLRAALAYWDGDRSPFTLARGARRETGAFVEMVADDALRW